MSEIDQDIVLAMARTLWVVAYANYVSESNDSRFRRARGGEDWYRIAPETPEAAIQAAQELANLYTLANGVSLEALLERAAEAEPDEHEPFGGDDFGSALAHMAMRDGVSWFDDHKRFDLARVDFEINFDGDYLVWSGNSEPAFPNPAHGPARAHEHSRFRTTARGVERGDVVRPRRHREFKASAPRPQPPRTTIRNPSSSFPSRPPPTPSSTNATLDWLGRHRVWAWLEADTPDGDVLVKEPGYVEWAAPQTAVTLDRKR